MLSTSDVARRLGVSSATVRNYTQEFGDHLSPEASPLPGQPRRFIEDDLRVMATAKALLAEGLTYEGVRERLAAGVHLVEEAELPPPPEPEPEPAETALVPMASVRLIIEPYIQEQDRVLSERDELLSEVRELREGIGHLRGRLEERSKSWLQRLLGR